MTRRKANRRLLAVFTIDEVCSAVIAAHPDRMASRSDLNLTWHFNRDGTIDVYQREKDNE